MEDRFARLEHRKAEVKPETAVNEAMRLPEPLLERQREFIGFLRARLGTEEAARDALQSAYVKAMEKAGTIRDDESTVAWFYKLLRNAVVDAHRRQQSEQKSLTLEQPEPQDEDLFRAVCICVGGVIDTLKPEYADLVRRVDLEGASVPDVARAAGITANNAGVKLHRARAALRDKLLGVCGACARHGCLDCRCRKQPL
jgi:RNA polymerase sigma-70 factor (ECF subfamily)